jgi:hypothetical protein
MLVSTVKCWSIRGSVYYGVHAQITTFPMPLNVNDDDMIMKAVAVTVQLCLQQEKVRKNYSTI